jgi:hypothetical protein
MNAAGGSPVGGGIELASKQECLGPGKNRGTPWTKPGLGGKEGDSVHATNRSQNFPGRKLALGPSP